VGRDNSVGIASRYGLDGTGDRNPVEAILSAPVHTGPGAHPASCTVGTGSFQEVKRPGRDVDHPPPSSVEIKDRIEQYIYCVACSVVFCENRVLLCYTQTTGNFLPTFRDSLSDTSWILNMGPIGCRGTLARNYHCSLHNYPEERSSHLLRPFAILSPALE
jgi:hypothetical protein